MGLLTSTNKIKRISEINKIFSPVYRWVDLTLAYNNWKSQLRRKLSKKELALFPAVCLPSFRWAHGVRREIFSALKWPFKAFLIQLLCDIIKSPFTTHHLCCDNSRHHKSIGEVRSETTLFCLRKYIYEAFLLCAIDIKGRSKSLLLNYWYFVALYLSYHISHAPVITMRYHHFVIGS